METPISNNVKKVLSSTTGQGDKLIMDIFEQQAEPYVISQVSPNNTIVLEKINLYNDLDKSTNSNTKTSIFKRIQTSKLLTFLLG